MCDIYTDRCKICGKEIEMHLGDYETTSHEIEVYCNCHIPDSNVTIWKCRESWFSVTRLEHYICGNPFLVGIRHLTDNARLNKEMNHPNADDCDIIEERI